MMDDGSPIITMRRDHYFMLWSKSQWRGASMWGGHRRSAMWVWGSMMGSREHQSTYGGVWWSMSVDTRVTICNEEDERFVGMLQAVMDSARIET